MVIQNVIAEIEIDGTKINNYFSVKIKQQFNHHHEFSVKLPHDVVSKENTFSLKKVENFIGKVIIIRLVKGSGKALNEFKGLIADCSIEQYDAYHSHIMLKGYSPTIILDNGPGTTCFLKRDLSKIVKDVTAEVSSECRVQIKPLYSKEIKYLTQYRESNFEFLNRLSQHFGEWFFYDGKNLNFGKPSGAKSITLVLGYDVTGLQLKLQLLPLAVKAFSYQSGDDSLANGEGSPASSLGEFGKKASSEAGKIFSKVTYPSIRPRPESGGALNDFLKIQRAGQSAELEVISGKSTNPEIVLGSIATLNSSENSSKKELGKYLITSVTHEIFENGKYENQFEGLPSAIEVVPVKNVKIPLAETQVAHVIDTEDPDNKGRVRVKMIWQTNTTTDWIRVLTPHAGQGGKNKNNRGYIFIPEIDDQVLVGFRYNDPDRPFVMGSIFNGKTGKGGGKDNKIKTLGTKGGNLITMDDDKGSMFLEDVKGNSVLIDGEGKIVINCTEQIELKTGDSSITLKKDGTIQIIGKVKVEIQSDQAVNIEGKSKVDIKSTQAVNIEGTTEVGIKGTNIAAKANANLDLAANASLTAKANASLTLEGMAMAKFSSAGIAQIQGTLVKIN